MSQLTSALIDQVRDTLNSQMESQEACGEECHAGSSPRGDDAVFEAIAGSKTLVALVGLWPQELAQEILIIRYGGVDQIPAGAEVSLSLEGELAQAIQQVVTRAVTAGMHIGVLVERARQETERLEGWMGE